MMCEVCYVTGITVASSCEICTEGGVRHCRWCETLYEGRYASYFVVVGWYLPLIHIAPVRTLSHG